MQFKATKVIRGGFVLGLLLLSSSATFAQVDDFNNQLGQILRNANPSIKAEKLGQQGVSLTNMCASGNMNACRQMEPYGHQWCQQGGDCTYLVKLMETECGMGDQRACALANTMHQRAMEGWQRRWGR